uniref:Stress-induced-phosphoprotein 1 n=1 Tax=Hirondellea gigas TaxID=1518452 RepID=A0A2P2HXJ6_9CRUS
MTMDNKTKAQELKDAGNAALNSDKPAVAVEKYTEAIEFDPENHVLFSNRSAAYAKLENYTQALKDAEATVKIKPDWAKGFSRKGAALVYLNRLDEAEEAYNAGLKIDPSNEQLKSGLSECTAKAARLRRPGLGMGLGFDDPNVMAKLAMDPRTRGLMNDPSFLKMIEDIVKDSSKMSEYIKDKRLMIAMSVLLGLDLRTSGGMDDDDDDSPIKDVPSNPKPKQTQQAKSAKAEKMEVDLSPQQQQAKAEKEKGNAAYKKKDFATATTHYEKAIEIDPTDMTFLNNLAAVKYEQKDYVECIASCDKAVEVGRENRADFKLIAKSLTRIGNAHRQLEDLQSAKTFYEKAMSEHRTPETKDLLSKIQKLIKEKDRLAYFDVGKSEAEKELGNQCFKKGDYPAAVKHYTEAVLRNPDDAKVFSNRAACYTKLAEFNLGMKDCDECIRLEPSFIKGYIRKAKIQQGLRQFSAAQESFRKALNIDPNHPEVLSGLKECRMASNSDPEEIRKLAMADPEVQQILKDPAMRIILEQMQSDPRALQDHLKNPEISAKIQKLMQSGLISIQ